jgi:capsular polysaccharide biosynthesis protein
LNMDLVEAAKLVLRQWKVLMVGLVVAGALVGGMAWRVAPTYSATATVLLLPPLAGGAYQPPAPAGAQAAPAPKLQPAPATPPPKLYNPYLSFDSSLYVLASIVAADLSSDDFKRQLQNRGATASYQVTVNSNEPAITVVATDPDPRRALDTANAVVNSAQADLVERQRPTGIPEENWVGAAPLQLASHAEPTNTALKVLLVVAGLGLLAAVSLTFVAESLGIGRRAAGRPRARSRTTSAPGAAVAVDSTNSYETGWPATWLVTDGQPPAQETDGQPPEPEKVMESDVWGTQ